MIAMCRRNYLRGRLQVGLGGNSSLSLRLLETGGFIQLALTALFKSNYSI